MLQQAPTEKFRSFTSRKNSRVRKRRRTFIGADFTGDSLPHKFIINPLQSAENFEVELISLYEQSQNQSRFRYNASSFDNSHSDMHSVSDVSITHTSFITARSNLTSTVKDDRRSKSSRLKSISNPFDKYSLR